MVKLIVAKAENNAIGKDNDLIWKLPDDMKFFTETTTGHVVVMGRKNWDSIPHKYQPLPDRINAVVTRNNEFEAGGCSVFSSVEDAIRFYRENEEEKTVFIIGGGQIYKYALDHNLVDEMLITDVHETFEGDTFFPDFDEQKWIKELIAEHRKDERHPHAFTIYRYKKAE